MNSKSFFKNKIFIIILLILISSILTLLLYLVFQYEKKIEKDIFTISTTDVLSITKNKAKSIQKLLNDSEDYISDIKNDKLLQKNIENSITDLITKNIKYSYLLYKDKNDIFRFLVDASNVEDKAFLNQKFDVDSSKWFELYKLKSPIIIKHELLHELSLTYLVPILQKDEVKLVLVIDFSIRKAENVTKVIDLLKKSISFIIIIVIIFFIIFIIQIIKYRSIKKSSFIDKLTGVYNRNYLHEVQDNVDLEEYVLAALDIDHFKKINDTYGHDIGDKVLKEVGRIMSHTIRLKDDIVIRYGGEEFVLLIKDNKKSKELALNVINRVFNNLKKHKFYLNENDFITITVSIGVNIFPFNSTNFTKAFKLADVALYEAKNSGRNKIKIYEKDK